MRLNFNFGRKFIDSIHFFRKVCSLMSERESEGREKDSTALLTIEFKNNLIRFL
jgi:hypothetical protein